MILPSMPSILIRDLAKALITKWGIIIIRAVETNLASHKIFDFEINKELEVDRYE
ncbi:hypothetical protein GPDM_02155 [Planococcus donghaensis MPA1U2]|uniref:Uncharacterized protein n=1 Tax=Planococcus donghaensis MPA1U2 TaxID=933115 RepID=E7RDA3_9BACL|nr:hypothetical protein GPDM_02155 [Planococcus donghaensis MPA1U2]